MASPDENMIKGFLQALESMLDGCDRLSSVTAQLLASQQNNKPLAPGTLKFYDEQLEIFAKQRSHMRDTIARWWTLMERQ
jgi:hypothetical protein